MNLSAGKFSLESIEKVLSSEAKWKNVSSTIQLAFTALSETLKMHENYIKDLELQLSNKVSRHELKAELAEKVSIQEISEKLAHNSSILDAKLLMFEDKISLADVQKLLLDRVKYDEAKKWLETKISAKEVNNEFERIYSQIDKVYQEICESLARIPNGNEMEYFNEELKTRPSSSQIEEIVNKKFEVFSKILKSKADKNDLIKKADSSDLSRLIGIVETKADCNSLEKIGIRIEKIEKNENFTKKRMEKNIKDTIEEIKELSLIEIDNKVAAYINQLDKYMNQLNYELNRLKENPFSNTPEVSHLKEKVNENAAWIQQEFQDLNEKMKDFAIGLNNEISIERANIRDIFSEKLENSEKIVKDLEKEIKSLYKEINSINSFVPIVKSIDERINSVLAIKIKDITNTCLGNRDDIKGIQENLSKKADFLEVQALLNDKNKQIVNNLHEIREDIKFKLQQISVESLKKSQDSALKIFEGIDSVLSQKVEKKDFERFFEDFVMTKSKSEEEISRIKYFFEENFKDLNQDFTEKINSLIIEIREKTWSSDIIKILENKPNIDDVNKALISIQNDIDEKMPLRDFNNFINENSVIINTLCAEICVGRWLWKMGEIKDKFISWDEENTNTNPLLFIWEAGRNFILVEEAGIYEVSFAIFSVGNIELFVNGQTIFCVDGSIDTNYSGSSKVEFLVLSARSRLSLKFWGKTGQGFISIRKL